MSKEVLNEREFELINIVGGQLAQNQRDLSRQLNISLGMTNMVLRRLVNKGYIRIQQLNQRKVHYILTPKGFTEKMKKSIRYTLKTINSIALIKNRLKSILSAIYEKGHREFWIVGVSDMTLLVEQVFKELGFNHCILHYDQKLPANSQGIVLLCKEDTQEQFKSHLEVIDMVQELSKDNFLIEQTGKD
jgi:DNA-binding MarR family transcriptional regulator